MVSDSDNNEILTIDNGNQVIKQNDVESKNFTDLNNEIQDNSSSTIQLSGNYKYSSSTDSSFKDGIQLRSNIIIDGQNKSVIDGSKYVRIFKGNNISNVTIKGIVFINSNPIEGNGAAILFDGYSQNITIDATFENNTGSNGELFSLILLIMLIFQVLL